MESTSGDRAGAGAAEQRALELPPEEKPNYQKTLARFQADGPAEP